MIKLSCEKLQKDKEMTVSTVSELSVADINKLQNEAVMYADGVKLRRGDGEVWEVLNGQAHFVTKRKGGWGHTLNGRVVYAQDMLLEDIHMEEMAHSLSNQCRWGGWTREFYSVAQHAVLVGLRAFQLAIERGPEVCPITAMWYGLRHDDSEAYLTDIPTPLKAYLPFYYEVEARVQEACMARFTIKHNQDMDVIKQIVKQADLDLLFMERDRYITNSGDPYEMEDRHPQVGFEVFREFEIEGILADCGAPADQPWHPKLARTVYKAMFNTFDYEVNGC